MQLKKNAPSNDVVKKLAAAGVLSAEEEPIPSSAAKDTGKPQVQKDAYGSPLAPCGPAAGLTVPSVHVEVDEVVGVLLNQDGGVESMEVKGELTLEVADAESGCVMVKVKRESDKQLQFRVRGPSPHAAAVVALLMRCRRTRTSTSRASTSRAC